MDSDQRWTKDRGMRGRLPTFAAVVIYGLISSFSSSDVCRRLSAEPSHGENRGWSPLGSAREINNLFGRNSIGVPKVSPRADRGRPLSASVAGCCFEVTSCGGTSPVARDGELLHRWEGKERRSGPEGLARR
jgi:hypothetical protein